MENHLNLMIIGATRYDIDGNRGGSLWAYSPAEAEADDDNRVGNEVMKIACDYKHIDQLCNHADRLPVWYLAHGKYLRDGERRYGHLKRMAKAFGDHAAARLTANDYLVYRALRIENDL